MATAAAAAMAVKWIQDSISCWARSGTAYAWRASRVDAAEEDFAASRGAMVPAEVMALSAAEEEQAASRESRVSAQAQ